MEGREKAAKVAVLSRPRGSIAATVAVSARDRGRAAYGGPCSHYLSRVHLARVVGRVVATVKQETLSGVTLQWLQPITARGASAGKPLVAVDRVGVGPGGGSAGAFFVTCAAVGVTAVATASIPSTTNPRSAPLMLSAPAALDIR